MFYRKLTYPAVIFSVIKPMVLKKSELTLPSKMQNTQFHQRKTILTRGIVIIGCIRNVIWLSVFSIKSKLFAELLLVMISLLHRFLLLCTLLPFGFCLRTCLHKKCVRIFEHNFVADKAKIRRRAVARQEFLTQSAAKFAEKTCAYACEDRF